LTREQYKHTANLAQPNTYGAVQVLPKVSDYKSFLFHGQEKEKPYE
jgi:hypothetical protein